MNEGSPSRVWGTLLVLLSHVVQSSGPFLQTLKLNASNMTLQVGKPERLLDQATVETRCDLPIVLFQTPSGPDVEVYRQMLAGNISGFAEFAQIRSVNLSALEVRIGHVRCVWIVSQLRQPPSWPWLTMLVLHFAC